MHRKATILGLALVLALSTFVIAQTNSFDTLIQTIQGLLEDKGTPVHNSFLDTSVPEGKTLEGKASNAFSEEGEEEPNPPSDTIESSLQELLSAKPATLEQGFLTSAKEPSEVGNEFDEEPSE
jgi:hypothetical protein